MLLLYLFRQAANAIERALLQQREELEAHRSTAVAFERGQTSREHMLNTRAQEHKEEIHQLDSEPSGLEPS